MSRREFAGPTGGNGPELNDVRGDCMNCECSETPTEPCAHERCLCLPPDDDWLKDEVDGDGDGARRDVPIGIAPSGGKCSTACTERAFGDRGGGLGGGTGLRDFSGTTGVGIMGTFGCVIACSHERSWPSSTGISAMPLISKK